MKKTLLTLVLASMIGSMSAQTKYFCMTDVFGFTADVVATRTGPGYWSLSGTGDVLAGYDWTLSGYMDKGTDLFYLNWINPEGPCDDVYVDNFEYYSTGHGGGTISFSWNNYYCGAYLGSGTGSTDFSVGACPFRMGGGTPNGPAVISEEPMIYNFSIVSDPSEPTLSEMLAEPELSVVRNNENSFTIAYELDTYATVTIDIYNHAGQFIASVVSGTQDKGFYKAEWNAADAVSGMYVAVMNVNGSAISQKIVK